MLQSASKLWKSRHRYTRSSLRHRKKIQIKFIWLQPWTFCFCVLSAARGRRWIELTVEEQRAYVMRLLDALEVTDRDKRLKVARAILYLAQGVWAAQNTSLFHSRHLGFRGNAHVLLLILTMAKSSTRSWQWARMHSTWNRMISLFMLFCHHLLRIVITSRLVSPGVFDECDTEVDVLHWSRHNIFLLYDMGIFTALLELLSMEMEWVRHPGYKYNIVLYAVLQGCFQAGVRSAPGGVDAPSPSSPFLWIASAAMPVRVPFAGVPPAGWLRMSADCLIKTKLSKRIEQL